MPQGQIDLLVGELRIGRRQVCYRRVRRAAAHGLSAGQTAAAGQSRALAARLLRGCGAGLAAVGLVLAGGWRSPRNCVAASANRWSPTCPMVSASRRFLRQIPLRGVHFVGRAGGFTGLLAVRVRPFFIGCRTTLVGRVFRCPLHPGRPSCPADRRRHHRRRCWCRWVSLLESESCGLVLGDSGIVRLRIQAFAGVARLRSRLRSAHPGDRAPWLLCVVGSPVLPGSICCGWPSAMLPGFLVRCAIRRLLAAAARLRLFAVVRLRLLAHRPPLPPPLFPFPRACCGTLTVAGSRVAALRLWSTYPVSEWRSNSRFANCRRGKTFSAAALCRSWPIGCLSPCLDYRLASSRHFAERRRLCPSLFAGCRLVFDRAISFLHWAVCPGLACRPAWTLPCSLHWS